MIFSSINFIIFWLISLVFTHKLRLNVPIAFGIIGLIFYSYQGYINLLSLLLVFLTTYIYFLLNRYLIAFIFLTLLPLFLFKYSKIINYLGIENEYLIFFQNHPIPPGLSFTTFSAIALILVIKNKSLEKINFKKILGYLFFFPQLIAGPIVLPKYLIPQLENFPKITYDNFKKGLFIFTVGICIKVILADSLALYIDPILSDIKSSSINEIIISIILFSQQIFFDFNGYTLMAIGIAFAFGINLPENFKAPYLATSISDFWRKWHITLSNWIRDFVYIPLGGSHCSVSRHYINIVFAMILSGIWHGYGFAFLLWGLFHGLLIVLEKMINFNISNRTFKIFYTYLTVTILWSLFRINSYDDWMIILSKDFNLVLFDFKIYLIFLTLFIFNFFQKFLILDKIILIYNSLNKKISITVSIVIIVFCCIVSSGTSQKFIYFNF